MINKKQFCTILISIALICPTLTKSSQEKLEEKIANIATSLKEKKLLCGKTQIITEGFDILSDLFLISAISFNQPFFIRPGLVIPLIFMSKSTALITNQTIFNHALRKAIRVQNLNTTANQRLSQQLAQTLHQKGLPKDTIEDTIARFLEPALHEYSYLEILNKDGNSTYLPIYKETYDENTTTCTHNESGTYYTKIDSTKENPHQKHYSVFPCTNTRPSASGASEELSTKGQRVMKMAPLLKFTAFKGKYF